MEIFIGKGGRSIGPIDLTEVNRLLAAHEITGSNPGMRKGDPSWGTVRDLPGLDLHLLPPQVSTLPPKGNLFGAYFDSFGTAFRASDGSCRVAVVGFAISISMSIIAMLVNWADMRSIFFEPDQYVALASVCVYGSISLALLRGEREAVRVGLIAAAVGLLFFECEWTSVGTGISTSPFSGIIYASQELGLGLAFAALMRELSRKS